jgi:hypothetical protein
MFNPNQAFLLVQKLKPAPNGFTLGVKAELERIFSICLKLLRNVESFMASYWPQGREKKGDHQI